MTVDRAYRALAIGVVGLITAATAALVAAIALVSRREGKGSETVEPLTEPDGADDAARMERTARGAERRIHELHHRADAERDRAGTDASLGSLPYV